MTVDLNVIIDTLWVVIASVLVFSMQAGFALVESGFTRSKNAANIMMKNFMDYSIGALVFFVFGFSLMFNGSNFGLFGTPDLFVSGDYSGLGLIIPLLAFVFFQTVFCSTSVTIVSGAVAERMKFSTYLVFSAIMTAIIYPISGHWVWGGGWIGEMGAIDFAGGTVVHINAGISALVMAVMLGKGKGWNVKGATPITPHNVPFVVIGTALLWLGWLGFNGGSGLAADGLSASALLVTNIAAAAAALTWAVLDWVINKKPTVVGFCTGVVAGLVAITPAAGSSGVLGAFVIGVAAGLICFFMVAYVKPKLGYDDSLDAFGVHGIGGIIGSILIGVFATQAITGEGGAQGALYGDWNQLWIQVLATAATIAFSTIMTWILFKIVDAIVGIRASEESESVGLDISEHGEIAYE